MRDFAKISFKQFSSDVAPDKNLYNSFPLPYRTSNHAAGYDFFLLHDLELAPGQSAKIPTGIRAQFPSDEVLLIIIRHSLGFKYNLHLCNQVGVIDSDYYDAQNEGHIFIKVKNDGEQTLKMPAGEAIAQGIFIKFLTTDSDNPKQRQRINEN